MVDKFEADDLNMRQYSHIGMMPFSESEWNVPHPVRPADIMVSELFLTLVAGSDSGTGL